MLVRELIAELQKMPQETEVFSGIPNNVYAGGPIFAVIQEQDYVLISEIEWPPPPRT